MSKDKSQQAQRVITSAMRLRLTPALQALLGEVSGYAELPEVRAYAGIGSRCGRARPDPASLHKPRPRRTCGRRRRRPLSRTRRSGTRSKLLSRPPGSARVHRQCHRWSRWVGLQASQSRACCKSVHAACTAAFLQSRLCAVLCPPATGLPCQQAALVTPRMPLLLMTPLLLLLLDLLRTPCLSPPRHTALPPP